MNEQQPLPRSTRLIYAAFDFGWAVSQKANYHRARRDCRRCDIGQRFLRRKERGRGRGSAFWAGRGYGYRSRDTLLHPVIDAVHIRKVKRIVQHQIASKSGGTANFTILSGDTNLFSPHPSAHHRIDNLRNFLYASVDPLVVVSMLLRKS